MKELPVEVGSQTLGDALRARMNKAIPEGSNRDVLAQMAATMALVGAVRNQAGAGKMFRQTGEKQGPGGVKIRVFEGNEPEGGQFRAGTGESTRQAGEFSTPGKDARVREVIKMATDEEGGGMQLKSTKDLYEDPLQGKGSSKDETGFDWGETVQAMLERESRDSRAKSIKELRGWKQQDKPAAPAAGIPKTIRPSAATAKSGPDKVRGNFMTRTVKAIEALPPEQQAKMADFRASQIEGVSPMTAQALRKRYNAER